MLNTDNIFKEICDGFKLEANNEILSNFWKEEGYKECFPLLKELYEKSKDYLDKDLIPILNWINP